MEQTINNDTTIQQRASELIEAREDARAKYKAIRASELDSDEVAIIETYRSLSEAESTRAFDAIQMALYRDGHKQLSEDWEVIDNLWLWLVAIRGNDHDHEIQRFNDLTPEQHNRLAHAFAALVSINAETKAYTEIAYRESALEREARQEHNRFADKLRETMAEKSGVSIIAKTSDK